MYGHDRQVTKKGMISTNNLYNSHENNFNLIRFIAAIAVIFSHSYPLSLGNKCLEPLQLDFGFTLGDLSVDVFFIISGFLITKSATYRDDWRSFLRSRFLRIYPALLLVIFITTFVIAPLYTSLALGDYLSDLRTYSYFIKDSILISGFKSAPPYVFEHNPFPLGMNGSLWTLPWEVKMYIMLGCLAYFTRKHLKKSIYIIALISSVIFALSSSNHTEYEISPFFRFTSFFFLGASIFLFKSKVPHDFKIFISILIVTVGLFFLNKIIFSFSFIIILPYLVIYLSYAKNSTLLRFNKMGDYSYGLYIWAFPIQQMIAYHFKGVQPIGMFLLTVLFTLPIAIMSYHYVEKKALKFKL